MGANMVNKGNADNCEGCGVPNMEKLVRFVRCELERRNQVRRFRRFAYLAVCVLFLGALGWARPSYAENTTYYVTNAQGTVVAEMDSGSNVTYEATYRPYGKQQNGVPQAGPGYTGHVNDPGTGLVYMQARYYDPAVGRFLGVDPQDPKSGNIFNISRYDYANNNPYRYTDPTGMSSSPECGEVSCVTSMMRKISDSFIASVGSGWLRPLSNAMESIKSKAAEAAKKVSSSAHSLRKRVQVKSVFAGDNTPTYTGGAGYGGGVIGYKIPGPNNDEVALSPVMLGGEATKTWDLLDVKANFSDKKPAPVYIGILGGKDGLIGVLGVDLKYYPPGQFELNISAGYGAAADVHALDVGGNVSQLSGGY